MLLTNEQQLLPLFYGVGFGVWIGLIHAAVYAWRRQRRTSARMRFWQDVWFAFLAGIALFLMLLPLTGGAWRLSVLTSVGVGYAVSYRLIRRPLTRGMHLCFRVGGAVDRFLRHLLTQSVLFLQKTFKKALFFSKKGLQSAFYMLYNKKST